MHIPTTELRPAVPADVLPVATIHVRAWQEAYRGLMPADYLAHLRPEDRAARYTFGQPDGPQTTVALRDGLVLGFATILGPELAALNVDPTAWRTGIGTALLVHARASIAATGAPAAHLWMLVGNTRAQRFYARDGWHLTTTVRQATVWGTSVEEVELRRPL